MRIPVALEQEWRREPRWLSRLPQLVRECAEQWGLELEEPLDTPHSLVVPAGDYVLKLNAPSHYEADHEAAALDCWSGRGAVQLVAHDDSKRALLMERCRPGTPLADSPLDDRSVIAELLPRLWIKPRQQDPFRLIVDEAEKWIEEVRHHYERSNRPFEQSLILLAVDVFRSSDRKADTLVNQDLHAGNILRAQREPWLVIDPKPALANAK
jgi:streptomycin 6-kinase